MDDIKNKREKMRRRTMFGGVVFDDHGHNWECSVSDISVTGVKIKLSQILEVGGEINLKINKYNDLRRCVVTWARGNEFGLRFLVPISEQEEDIYRLLKPLDGVRR